MKKINNILSLLALGLGITTMASCNSNKTSESESSNTSQQESLQPSENPSENQSTSEKITLTGFDVEDEVNASFGNSFTLPTFTPIDQNNNIYSVKVKVVCDGKEVAIVNNKIDINSMKDYVVTFTVEGLDNVSKVMVIKVKDLVKPTITLEKLNTFYSENEQITLPKASIIDNVDEDLACKFQVTKDNQVILDNIQNTFTLSETGKYTLVATCVDSSGNEGKETIDFIIRSTPSKGEIEDFKDVLAFDCVKAINNNDGLAIKSELVSFKGKDAIKITSTNANDEAVKYPGLSLTPRISKEQAQTLLDDDFKFVSVEYYIDYNAKRNIYQKWDGQKSYATTLNTWATINLPLDTFVANYDKIASGDASLFYIGNEATYVEDGICAVFDFYVSSIYVTKNINTDITFADNGIQNEASCNSQIEVSKITASYLDATFSYEYFDPNGNPLEVTDGKITLNNPGIYEIVATANEKCYSGSATYQIVVKATLEQVNSLVNEILSASDISLMQEKANTLKAYYVTLSTEDKNKVNAFEYVRATNLLTLKEDVIYYFDETAGKDQVTLQYDAKNTEVSTKDGVSYVTDVKYGNEKGSTKFTFKDVPSEWFSPYTIVLSTPAIEDLSAYQYIRFYVQGYCYKADRPITFAITVNDKRITPTINPVEAKNGNWVEVLVPVSELTGNIKIKVYTHNGNDYYGSVWNDPTRMYVYLSNIKGVKAYNDFTFASDFTLNTRYETNTTLSLEKMSASASNGSVNATKYVLVKPDGSEEEVTSASSIDLSIKGQYTLKAIIDNEKYYNTICKEFVVADPITLADVNALIEEILNASDISLMQEKADTLKAYYADLSTEDKNKVNAFEYVRATNLLTLKEDVIYYFDETAGKDQVTLQYDAKNTEVSTKDGVSYVTDVKYGNEKGSTKFTFKDVPSEWFSPYTIVLSTPAIEDLSAYQYIRFYVQGYCYKADRPITFAITVNDKRITPTINPVEAKNGNWVEVLVPVSELTGNIKIKVYTHNGNDYYGSVWNDPTRMYVYLSNIKGVKAYNDFTFASDFTLNTRYETNTTLSLEKMSASASNGSVNATKYVLVKPDGSEVEINSTSEITLIEEGRYELKAIIDNGKYYNTICKEFVVADPDNGITYLAKVKSDIVTRGYGTDKVPSTYLTEFEGVKNVIKASTIVSDGASTNAYKWPGFNLKSRLSLEEIATLKAKGYTKFVLPIYVTGNKEQDVVLNDKTEIVARITPNKWNYIEISIDKLTATSMDYFAYIYNLGKGNPTEAEKDIVYYISDIYLKQEDMLKVFDNNETSLSNFIVKEGSNVMTGATLDNEVVYGKETASVKYVITNSDTYAAAFYFNQDFAFEGYEKAYVNMRVSNSSNNKLAFTLYNGDSRIIDLRHVYLTQDEWYRVEVPTALFSNLNTLNIRVVCNLWGSAIPTGTTFNFSNVYVEKSDSLVISTIAYGKDIVRASYVEEFNGENHVFKASTDTKLLASSNSWKYPGFKVFMPYSLEKLQELKEQGYTALNVRLYVEDSSQSTQDVLWGLSPNDKIATIETNKWQDVALSIDTLIANYSSYFTNYQTNNSQYLFYINNFKYSSSAAHINIYTSTVTFVK